jgi:hypothetical protein
MPGSPTRVGDTSFTITDTGNANLYNLLFCKGTVLTWMEDATWQTGMVISATYSGDAVTITIVGNSLTAGFSAMKYAADLAMKETFVVPGSQTILADCSKQWVTPYPIYGLSEDAIVDTKGTTNSTTYDVNDDGTSLGANPSIAAANFVDLDNSLTPAVIATGSVITVDVDAACTTPAVDGYIVLWYYPESWRYRT